MNNMKSNVWSFATAKLQATIVKMFSILTIVAVTAFSMAACKDDSGDDGGGDGYWLRTVQRTTTYAVTDGTPEAASSSYNSYKWIAYRYTNKTDYEEEYATSGGYRYDYSYSEHHYTRNGQASHSTTETISWDSETDYPSITSRTEGTTETTATYDLSSGLTSSLTTISSTGVTTTNYAIEMISDTGEVKNYKYYPLGSTWYNIYKIQNGRTLEVSYYNDSGLLYTTTYIWPDIAEIRSKLPDFTIYSTNYYSSSYSIHSSHQTVEVLPNDYSYQSKDSYFKIRVKTFNDGVLSSETDYEYEKINFKRDRLSDALGIPVEVPGEGYIDVDLKHWGDYDYGELNGKIIIFYYKGTGGNVNIPARINGKPVTEISSTAFSDCYNLTGVTIPDGVTIIGYAAFADCYKLASVTIPNSVTRIGWSAFSDCYRLANITIPDNAEEIGRGAFDRTKWFDQWFNNQPDGLAYMGKVAYLYKGDMPANTSIVLLDGTKGIGPAFIYCSGLTGITIPNSVTNIGSNAFYRCFGLSSVTIPNSVESIGLDAFGQCTSLTSVTFEKAGVTFEKSWSSLVDGFIFPFEGDLCEKYLAGGAGTYTTTTPVPASSWNWKPVWTKQ